MSKKLYKDQRNNAKFYIEAFYRVVDWNAISRGKSRNNNEEFIASFDDKAFELQISLVTEELKEYSDAIRKSDHVEAVDAMADTFVVASFLTYMFFGEKICEEFLNTQVGDRFNDDPHESFLSAREAMSSPEQMAFYAATIMRQARDSLNKTYYDGAAALTEVLNSNDSKFPSTATLIEAWEMDIAFAVEEEKKWIRDNRGYGEVTATYNPDYDVYVFHDVNKKIMKPSIFIPANIAKIVKGA